MLGYICAFVPHFGTLIQIISSVKAILTFVKFRLSLLVVFSAAIGFIIGTPEEMDWFRFWMLIAGGVLITGSANGFNQIIERDLDNVQEKDRWQEPCCRNTQHQSHQDRQDAVSDEGNRRNDGQRQFD